MRHCVRGVQGAGSIAVSITAPIGTAGANALPQRSFVFHPLTTIHACSSFTTSTSTAQSLPAMSTTYDDGEPQMTLQHEPNRPTSIDLTLALERELDNESLPNSPNPPRPQSLDTHVLASIVTQLRLSLAEVTKERDTLSEQLAEAQTREGGLKEALEHVTDKCLRCENELEGAAAKRQEDEETISMLRTKVEESRYVALATMCATPC